MAQLKLKEQSFDFFGNEASEDDIEPNSESFFENLEVLTTDILRHRAEALAIENWQNAGREDLLASLQAYRDEVITPSRVMA